MKKVILNDTIVGLRGDVLMDYDYTGAEPTLLPVKFGSFALNFVLSATTESDEDTMLYFSLAEKLQENLNLDKPTELELSDEWYAIVYNAMKPQAVLVKARFLQMVAKLNKAK